MRLGVFGGTFDPIHLGHLDVARAAREALALDEVWLVPSRLPPHRTAPLASPAHRFAMVALAADGTDELLASDLEMETAGPSYTSDSLDRIATLGYDVRSVFFITGADAFRDLPSWKGYPHILDRCHFVVVSRPGTSALEAARALPSVRPRLVVMPDAIPEAPGILLVDRPTAPVSSTDVRKAVAAGQSTDGLVPDRVGAYIRRQGLYRGRRPAPGLPTAT